MTDDSLKVERDYFATEHSRVDAKLKELIDQWQLAAGKHKDAAEDEDSEPGSEEWRLHQEAARVFARCADELALAVYRPNTSVSPPTTTRFSDVLCEQSANCGWPECECPRNANIHSPEAVAYAFNKARELLFAAGFEETAAILHDCKPDSPSMVSSQKRK